MMETNKNIEQLEQEMNDSFTISDFFQLLSVSLQYPTKTLALAMAEGSYREDAISILKELSCQPQDISPVADMLNTIEEDPNRLFVQMRQEYTRLFNDPKKPMLNIYESLFLYKPQEKREKPMLFVNPAALDAEHRYKEADVSPRDQNKEPADHIATELEFMMYLYAKKGHALQHQNDEELEKVSAQIRRFEEFHMKNWINDFFCCLENETGIAPYQTVAKFAKAGLERVLVEKAELIQ
jgi:TorA maturation chaperone TorD